MSTCMSIPNRIIAVLIAVWIPFCCCTLRVAAEATLGEGTPARSCCGGVSNAPCDGEDSDSERDSGGHCTSCCVKVIPDPPTEWSPELELATVPMFEIRSIELVLQDAHRPDSLRARAPDPPPNRTLLQQRCLLLV